MLGDRDVGGRETRGAIEPGLLGLRELEYRDEDDLPGKDRELKLGGREIDGRDEERLGAEREIDGRDEGRLGAERDTDGRDEERLGAERDTDGRDEERLALPPREAASVIGTRRLFDRDGTAIAGLRVPALYL